MSKIPEDQMESSVISLPTFLLTMDAILRAATKRDLMGLILKFTNLRSTEADNMTNLEIRKYLIHSLVSDQLKEKEEELQSKITSLFELEAETQLRISEEKQSNLEDDDFEILERKWEEEFKKRTDEEKREESTRKKLTDTRIILQKAQQEAFESNRKVMEDTQKLRTLQRIQRDTPTPSIPNFVFPNNRRSNSANPFSNIPSLESSSRSTVTEPIILIRHFPSDTRTITPLCPTQNHSGTRHENTTSKIRPTPRPSNKIQKPIQ